MFLRKNLKKIFGFLAFASMTSACLCAGRLESLELTCVSFYVFGLAVHFSYNDYFFDEQDKTDSFRS